MVNAYKRLVIGKGLDAGADPGYFFNDFLKQCIIGLFCYVNIIVVCLYIYFNTVSDADYKLSVLWHW